MNLKGYCHPLSPSGKAAILPDPPYHYGSDWLFIKFRADEKVIREWLPPPLEPGREPDLAMAYVANIMSVGDKDVDAVFANPAMTHYMECGVILTCQYKDEPSLFVPAIWVDQDWAMIRGWIQGLAKKIAKIYMTWIHPLNPKLKPLGIGTKLGGIVERQGDRLLTLGLEIKKKGSPSDLPKLGNFFALRHFPNIDFSGPPAIHDLVYSMLANQRVGDIWVGKGALSFGKSENEELLPLQPKKVEDGAFLSMGYSVVGGKVVHVY
ncbi:MAG: acetoacetate decarboxylase family protein [Thaumarchaeota archaeon]|nr:acetoacetate decarboxylase family protein [Nitrososphaerota archaeon]